MKKKTKQASQPMMRVCSADEMKQMESFLEKEHFLSPEILMENAGMKTASLFLESLPDAGRDHEILVFCGKGNNGGDGYVIARILSSLGRKVRVFQLEDTEKVQGASLVNLQRLQKTDCKIYRLENPQDLEAYFESSSGPFYVVDAILGTGLRGSLGGLYYDVVQLINENADFILSCDLPSGVHSDTGEVAGASILSDLTVSYAFPKLAHFLPPGAARRGKLVNINLSFPHFLTYEGDKYLLMKDPIARLLQERDRYGHKNSFGHTLLIGGSPGKVGAISMAARASHKMGTGLVTVATWEESYRALANRLPDETMSVAIKSDGKDADYYIRSLELYSSIVVGPGLSTNQTGKILLEELLKNYRGPLVIDADALNLLSEYNLHNFLHNRPGNTVLTPHPGEMARLLKMDKEQVVQDPVTAVKKAVELTHSIVVLKGAVSVIGSPEEVIYLNHYPNDGMATAGSGDVLAGMIGGLLGQDMNSFQATLTAVYLHSLSGGIAAEKNGHRSMTANDLIDSIRFAFQDLKQKEKDQEKSYDQAWLL